MADAKSVMTKDPFLLGSGESIVDAVEVYNARNFTTAPVITPLGEVLGQLTDMDLLKALVHYKNQGAKYSKVIHAKDYFDPIFYVNEDDHLKEVIRVMTRSSTHRVLVKGKRDKIVGIISPKDILHKLHQPGSSEESIFEELQNLYKENESLKEKLSEMSNYLSTYDAVFQSGLYMLHSVDGSGKLILANDKLHETLGYDPGELLGMTIFDIYPASVHREAAAGLKKVMADGRHNLTYSSMVKKDGSVIRVDLASASLRDENGQFLGTFTISRQYGSDAMLRSLHGVFDDSSKGEES